MSLRYLLIFILVTCVAACTDFHTELENPADNLVPESYSSITSPGQYSTPWWLSFNNPELTGLIESGLENNFTIQQAWARLSQAAAVAKQAETGLYPSLGTTADAAHYRSKTSNSGEITSDDFSLGLTAVYEIDLWGRVKSMQQAAEHSAYAKREDLHGAAMSVSGEIAATWLELISTRQKIEQLYKQLELNTRLLELVELRFRSAKAGALDVYQQNQTVTAIEGGLITLHGNEQVILHQLAVLTGRPPGTELNISQVKLPTISPLPPGGLPAELLVQRPDVRSAGYLLEGATWSVAAAKADRLPSLQLSGNFTYNSSGLSSLLDTWILGLAAGLTAPLIDNGARKAEVERSEAVVKEYLASYRRTLLNAILEVEDALVQEQQLRKGITNIHRQLELTQMAYREATWRYLNGRSDYLPVLREQINLITTQQDRITLEKDVLLARVAVCKALGGSWMEELLLDQNKINSAKQISQPEGNK